MERIDTRHAIETPEGVTFAIRPAGPYVRAQAAAVDTALRGAAIMIVMIVAGALGQIGQGLALIATFSIYWGYYIVFEMYFEGMTPGKRIFEIQVRSADGTPVNWRGSIVRNLLRLVDFLPFGYLAGLVSMSGSERFQRLGDLAGDTLVCYRPSGQLPNPTHLPDVDPVAPPARLSVDEQGAIVRFAARTRGWTPSRNRELATLAEPVTGTQEADEGVRRLQGMAVTILRGS